MAVAASLEAAMTLSEVLNEIWSAKALPLHEKRRLARSVSLGCIQSPRQQLPEPAVHTDTLYTFEKLLSIVAHAAGQIKIDISGAKAWLRSRGEAGVSLASRLGKASSGRNCVAHPDVSLGADLMKLCELNTEAGSTAASVQSGGTLSEQQSEDEQSGEKSPNEAPSAPATTVPSPTLQSTSPPTPSSTPPVASSTPSGSSQSSFGAGGIGDELSRTSSSAPPAIFTKKPNWKNITTFWPHLQAIMEQNGPISAESKRIFCLKVGEIQKACPALLTSAFIKGTDG